MEIFISSFLFILVDYMVIDQEYFLIEIFYLGAYGPKTKTDQNLTAIWFDFNFEANLIGFGSVFYISFGFMRANFCLNTNRID